MRQYATVELGMSVKEQGLPSDDIDQMTTLPLFHARDGTDKVFVI